MNKYLGIISRTLRGEWLDKSSALSLADYDDLDSLTSAASTLRDQGHGQIFSYSPKVFIPLTRLCRDVCHYCTFAATPKNLESAFLKADEVLAIARAGKKAGCHEALFTLGDKPELRYRIAREELEKLGHPTTVSYLAEMARLVFEETGLLPHLNPGVLSEEELKELRKVSVSQGIMLESVSERLLEPGMPHHGSPDKDPVVRLKTIEEAGKQKIPFTSGILIGIGETRRERIESLLALRDLNQAHGHLQEIIIQNFRRKPNTKMSDADEPSLNELLWTIAVTRLIFGPEANIQAPPNLSPESLRPIIRAGINDWGGVSPVTLDHVNPEAPWPHLERLRAETKAEGKHLMSRLALYPEYASQHKRWVDESLHKGVLDKIDATGYPREEDWASGAVCDTPKFSVKPAKKARRGSGRVYETAMWAASGLRLNESDIKTLFSARGRDQELLIAAADELRKEVVGDNVTYIVNRNINYTNICGFKCQFCAFSKTRTTKELRMSSYDLPMEEIQDRTNDAWRRGAIEVCLQGGIHPSYTGQTYLDVCDAIKQVQPNIHIHAFSPLEVWQGAKTLGIPLKEMLLRLKRKGLGTLPGTAAEILDDDIRKIICADKLTTDEWLLVMKTAHELGFKTTSTIMFGHVEQPVHWARHLLRIRDLQEQTGGFTEFVPLPFVHMETPIYRKGKARKGPTFRESILMHAVARLVLHPHITNIQTSWTKMGRQGALLALQSGANDMGGTLMNESISRAAGASHGQELPPKEMEALIHSIGRTPLQRNTAYGLTNSDALTVSNIPIARMLNEHHVV